MRCRMRTETPIDALAQLFHDTRIAQLADFSDRHLRRLVLVLSPMHLQLPLAFTDSLPQRFGLAVASAPLKRLQPLLHTAELPGRHRTPCGEQVVDETA
jgi:hypothetical protein